MFGSWADGAYNPRAQGDAGELAAIDWLGGRGYKVAIPLGHSPDWDLIAEIDGKAVRVQVKTCGCVRHNRYTVAVCTRGGNQSWNGLVKRFGPDRCDYLFVLCSNGRQWFIPSDAVEGATAIALGGPKYAAYEVEPGRPFLARTAA